MKNFEGSIALVFSKSSQVYRSTVRSRSILSRVFVSRSLSYVEHGKLCFTLARLVPADEIIS